MIDLSGIGPEEEITALRLANSAAHLKLGMIALLRTCWDLQRDWSTPAYWMDAPWLSADACHWLLSQRPSAVAFDFPQDFVIRQILGGEMPPIEEHVSHHILLRNEITLIEYLVNTVKLEAPELFLCALSLKVTQADGAPARVVAWNS